MDPQEKEIVDDILAGNIERFEEIVLKYKQLVLQMVSQLIKSPFDVEEVCQEVFVKIYQNLKTFRGEAKFSTWIARIAYNTSLNYLKKKKPSLYNEISDKEKNSEKTEAYEETLLSELKNPEESMIQKDLQSIITSAIAILPPRYRIILVLFHQSGFTYEEIARITGMPQGTVKNYLFRARKGLKNILEKNFQVEELLT